MGSNPFIDVSWVTRKPGVWNTVVYGDEQGKGTLLCLSSVVHEDFVLASYVCISSTGPIQSVFHLLLLKFILPRTLLLLVLVERQAVVDLHALG